jgi:uncharacterized RDD family membrane protein YckC
MIRSTDFFKKLEVRMFCTNCGSNVEGEFCTNCGARPGLTDAAASAIPVTDVGLRVAGYLLDAIPAIVVGLLVGWIPVVGAIILGFILLIYWLLRDIAGSSLGKLILGLKVVKKDGSPSGASQRILRNLPIAFGPALLIIPLAGYVIAPVVAVILILTEAILLLTKKERMGDMLAGTTVVKKSAAVVVAPPSSLSANG